MPKLGILYPRGCKLRYDRRKASGAQPPAAAPSHAPTPHTIPVLKRLVAPPPGHPPARAVQLVAAGILIGLGACDPCTGIVACEGEPVFRAGGWIVDRESGSAVRDVRVTFLPADGGETTLPPTLTTSDGRWETAVEARSQESLTGRFLVEAPGRLAYETDETTIRRLTRGGGEELGRWTSEPFIAFTGELWFPDRRPRTARVQFVRTGGAMTEQERITLNADRFGRFFLQLDMLEAGAVTGDLRVSHADLPRAFTLSDFRIPFKHHDEALPLDRVIQVGPSLAYLGRLWRRSAGTRVPAEGVQTEFRRIDGIQVSPSVVRDITVDWGGFSMVMATFEEGVIRGVLSAFLPPNGEAVVLDTLSLPTFETAELRSAGEWTFGPQVNYQAGLRDSTTGDPMPNVGVAFVRTGGLVTEPASVETVTDAEGRFFIRLHVEEAGTVEGEIRVSLPGGGTAIIPAVQFEAREDDDLHFIGWLEP